MFIPLSPDPELSPNRRAMAYVEEMIRRSTELRIEISDLCGATVIDCGVQTVGGYEAGLLFSKVCLGGLADVTLTWQDFSGLHMPALMVATDHPIRACMASQYAGWTIRCAGRSYIGSGPACAVACRGSLFKLLAYRDDTQNVVLCLESGHIPTEDLVDLVTNECTCKPENLTILVAPTNSIVGTVQVAARALETALFKLRRIGYALGNIVAGSAVCPVSPTASTTIDGLGRTNDAISYGSTSWISVLDTDENLEAVIGQVPASAAPGYGLSYKQFGQGSDSVFSRGAEGFNPAVIWVNNLNSGNTFTAGELREDVMRVSFGIK